MYLVKGYRQEPKLFRGLSGLAGLAGLGETDTGSSCAPYSETQKVPTAERDALRQRLSNRYFDWQAQTPKYGPGGHWHNGHPDIKRWLNDLMPRIYGLYSRPKLLRCEREARRRAEDWLGDLDRVLNKLKGLERKITLSDGRRCQATYIPAGGMRVSSYRLPVYNFRPGYFCLTLGGDVTRLVQAQGTQAAQAAAVAETNGADVTPATTGNGGGVLPPAVTGAIEAITEGTIEIPGAGTVPRAWLAYGLLAAVGLYFFTRR